MYTAADAEKIVSEKYDILPLDKIPEEAKDLIIVSVNQTLEEAASIGLCPEGLTYDQLIGSWDWMYRFIEVCNRYPHLYLKRALDKKGNPIKSHADKMACGITLAQVEQFLVTMTAKTQFNKYLPEGMDARKYILMRPYFAFKWQLPYLPLYEEIKDEIILSIGPDLLEIQTRSGLEALLSLKLDEISQGREILKENFPNIMRMNPAGIRNLLNCTPEQFEALKAVLDDEVYAFLCRESELFKDVLKAPPELISLFGKELVNVRVNSFKRLNKLPKKRSIYFMKHLVEIYPEAIKRFEEPEFVDFIIKKAVDGLIAMHEEKATFEEVVDLKVKAMKEILQPEVSAS